MAALKQHHRKLFIICGVLLLLGIIGSGTAFYLSTKNVNPITETLAAKTPYSLYYSQSLPGGFHTTEGSAYEKDGVVVYTISTDDGKKLYVSQQKTPTDLDKAKFYKDNLQSYYEIPTPSGQVTIGEFPIKPGAKRPVKIISLVTDTWLLANTYDDISNKDLETIGQGLVRN